MKKHKRNSNEGLKDMGAIAAGAALGGGLGYLAQRQIHKSYGTQLKYAPPASRLKYLVPATTATVGALALSKTLKSRAKSKREQMRKMSSFQREWVYKSLTEPWQ